jgi:5'-deoxynucleotidase YfbR-like HD superfamily hydrolase
MTRNDFSEKPALKEVSDIDFADFNGREEALQNIVRYDMSRFTPMFYRTNVLLHSKRVYLLIKDVLPLIVPVYNGLFNSEEALTLALIHDDAEIVSGDVLRYHAERWPKEKLAQVRENEEQAIEVLSNKWPKNLNGFNYKTLLYNALNKDTLEAQIVSFFDKIDAYCECLHEVFAGNKLFVNSAFAYVERLDSYPIKFRELSKIIPSNHPLLVLPKDVALNRLNEIAEQGMFHTDISVSNITEFPQYDKWKEITIKNFNIEPLIEAREK